MGNFKNKLMIGILTCILILILMNSFGVVDLNLYRSNLEVNQNSSIGYAEKLTSYDISFEYDGKTIYNHYNKKNSQEPVSLIIKIDNYKYSGNYYLPFYKSFLMEYKCSFSTANKKGNKSVFDESGQIEGNVEGSVKSKIIGLCSMKKAKDITETKAVDSIKKYIIDTLSK